MASAVLPLLWIARGIPLGEPVLDDFDYLYESYFRRPIDWLSGYGTPLFWRPVSRQLYYLLVAPFAVSHPWLVAALQAALLALVGVLLYRALRPAWPAPMAAAAAVIPVAIGAGVQVITYSSCAQDLLALVFGAASLHALSRGRTGLAVAWVPIALLSKESAVAFAAAMPLWPAMTGKGGEPAGLKSRARVAAGAGVVGVAWWLVHEWVFRHAGLSPAPHIAGGGGPVEKLAGAAARIGLEVMVAADPRSALARWVPWAMAVVTVAALGAAFAQGAGRARLNAAWPWLAWAAAYTALATLPVAWYMPSWGSYRAVAPALGVGVGAVALIGAAGGWAVASFSALRLVALLATPPAPDRIPATFAGTNMEFDVPTLGTLQKLARDVHLAVTHAHPTLPRGARVVRYQWPRMSELLFAERKAFRVWYRDSTLRMVGMAELQHAPSESVDLVVDFEPLRTPQVAIIAPAALHHVLLAADSLRHGRAAAAEALLAEFEREQPDTNAAVFLATGLALRGAARLAQGHDDEALAALQSAIRTNPDDANAHRVLAEAYRRAGQTAAAETELRRHLALMPNDAEAARMLDALLGGGR